MRTPLKQLNNAERDETLLAKKVISQIKDIKIRKIVVPKISQMGPKAVLINLTLILVIARVIHKL